MNKGVLIGGGAGLLLLLILGGYWIAVRGPQEPAMQNTAPSTTAPSGAVGPSTANAPPSKAPLFPPIPPTPSFGSGSTADAATPSPVASPPAPGSAAPAQSMASVDKKPLTREERLEMRNQVRAKIAELQAKGQNATTADTLTFLNDVEKLGQGVFDPQYFSTVREMVGYSARAQALNKELSQVASSRAPEDVARQQEILQEMRDVSDRVTSGAAAMQAYTRDAMAEKTP